MRPPIWMVHRAQILAHQLLLATYVPAPGVPAPGSMEWERAVMGMAAGLLHQAMQLRDVTNTPPTTLPFIDLGPGAVEATRRVLLNASREERRDLFRAAERAANEQHG